MTVYYPVFVVGPAGAGKSTFVAAFADWLAAGDIPYITLNLDPAAEYLPYVPDIDVRTYVTARQVMEEYELGPNGAIVASVDLMLNYVHQIREEVEESAEGGYVLIDTPGQLEIFAFRQSGVEVARELVSGNGCVAFLIDSYMAKAASSLVSQLFLAASTYYRFKMPQLNLLNKIDLLSQRDIETVIDWIRAPESLVRSLEEELTGEQRMVMRRLVLTLEDFLGTFSTYLVSGKQSQGLGEVYAELQRVYMGGEDHEVPEHIRSSNRL